MNLILRRHTCLWFCFFFLHFACCSNASLRERRKGGEHCTKSVLQLLCFLLLFQLFQYLGEFYPSDRNGPKEGEGQESSASLLFGRRTGACAEKRAVFCRFPSRPTLSLPDFLICHALPPVWRTTLAHPPRMCCHIMDKPWRNAFSGGTAK